MKTLPALATLRVAYTHPTLGPVYVARCPPSPGLRCPVPPSRPPTAMCWSGS